MAGHPGEKITEGLDGLRDRLAEYSLMGARFAKWRADRKWGQHSKPWLASRQMRMHWLVMPPLCQEVGLVPVVEPEVLMDGGHTSERCSGGNRGSPPSGFQPAFTHKA